MLSLRKQNANQLFLCFYSAVFPGRSSLQPMEPPATGKPCSEIDDDCDPGRISRLTGLILGWQLFFRFALVSSASYLPQPSFLIRAVVPAVK